MKPPPTRDEIIAANNALARIDAMLAARASLNPLQRAELDRMLRAAHRAQQATALTNRVLGK